MRILLFLGVNFAILLVLGIVFSVLGIDGLLDAQGVHLDLMALLVYSLVIGFAGSFISLALSKWIAKRTMRVRVIEQPANRTEQWLVETVRRHSEVCHIQPPEFGIFDSPQPNAFATGMNKNNALVAVSTGLLKQMSQDEVEAVVGHEMAHVANGDMVTMALLQGVLNTFVVFLSRVIGFLVDRLVFRVQRGFGPGYYIVSIVAQILLSVLATIVVMWFSRRREFRADAGGAYLAGRDKMISALQRLREVSQPRDLPDTMAAFGISGARPTSSIRRLFLSHPPLEERIRALQNDEIRP